MAQTLDYTRTINEECGDCGEWVEEAFSEAGGDNHLLWFCPNCHSDHMTFDYFG